MTINTDTSQYYIDLHASIAEDIEVGYINAIADDEDY